MAAAEKIFGVFNPGQEFDSWRIEAALPKGNQGGVLKATDISTDTLVALKIPFIFCPADRQRFEREREILESLDHPGVIALLGKGAYKGELPYIVLTFCDGERLDRFADRKCLTFDDRCKLFLLVCEAVEYVHDHDVVHCDLNPSNVLVTDDGKVKVIDFGSGFMKGRRGHSGMGTEHRGTPQYMSPEQILGESLDERTDVYSLGVILYELLCGSTPFGQVGEDENAALTKEPERPSAAVFRTGRVLRDGKFHSLAPEAVAHCRRTTPDLLASRLKVGLDEVLLAVIHSKRDRRFATVKQIMTAVENAMISCVAQPQ